MHDSEKKEKWRKSDLQKKKVQFASLHESPTALGTEIYAAKQRQGL